MQIDGNTQLIGIIANPISHVRTPQLFNASVAKQGLNIVCLPFQVEARKLLPLLSGVPALNNLLGLIVTIPHKESVLAACGELTDTAQLVGSVNAMRFDRNKHVWIGGNFDGEGFVAGLRDRGHTLLGKRVLLVGAGGAGKSIAYAIARERPSELVIHNRSASRANELAMRLKDTLADVMVRVGEEDPSGFDVVVNATSLGLTDTDALPLPTDRLEAGTLVCEAVVRDGHTPLLEAAIQCGCMVHHGQHMLYGQIVQIAQFLNVPLQPQFVEQILGPVRE